MASKSSISCLGDSSHQVGLAHWLEFGILSQESLWDLANHSALLHVVNHMGGVIAIDKISVENAQLWICCQCFLLSILALLNPRLLILTVGHVMLNWADCNHAGDAMLLSQLGRSNQEIILAGGHGCIVMGEVDYLVSTLNVNVQGLCIGCLSLVKLNSILGQVSLEGVHTLFVRSEVKETNTAVFTTLDQLSNHTLGNVVCTVDNYKLHHSLLSFAIYFDYNILMCHFYIC